MFLFILCKKYLHATQHFLRSADMTSENNNEKKFKQSLQSIIQIVSDAINNINGKSNEKQLIKEFNLILKKLLDDCLSSLSSPYKNYLLQILYQYNYNDQDKIFTKDMLKPFLHDIKGALESLDASQAAFDGNQAIVKQYIDKYSTLKNKSGLHGTTMLYSAARNNHFPLVKYLIETAHCSPNAQNEEHLEKGQSPTVKATIGSTPLHAACFHGHLPIVKYLIQHGGNYFILNNASETPVENGQLKAHIQNFFRDFLIFDYSANLNILPTKSILDEIEQSKEQIIDCFWEYKPLAHDQWFPFQPNPSNQLQQSLLEQPLKIDIRIQASRDISQVSIPQFLRSGKNNDSESYAWIRCRGSSLRNFHCYSHWQFMLLKHPTGITNPSPTTEILEMKKKKIQLNSWYNCDDEMNFILETAMNYRRKFINLNLSFFNKEKITFDFQNFAFNNQQNTIEGYLRWIPKLIFDKTKLKLIDNFQTSFKGDVILLTTSHLKQAQQNGSISSNEMNQYNLNYEQAFENDDLDFVNKVVNDADVNGLINVVQGDLLADKSDVIVITTSSKYLVESVVKAGGKSFQKAYENNVVKSSTTPVIDLPSGGELASKAIYFVHWHPGKDHNILCQSIEKLVSNVITKAANENHKSIAFPAIGCGKYGCPISLVAGTLVKQVQQLLTQHPMTITFVIQPDNKYIYDEFRKQVGIGEQQDEGQTSSLAIGKGLIEIIRGNITKQKVDVIIGSSSSENLRQILLKAGGDQVEQAYAKEYKNNQNSLIIITPPGDLPCQKIFFLKWEPDTDPDVLRQSIIDLIYNLIQNVKSHNFTSIAFPALGCGEHACSVDIVVKTMVREMKKQIKTRKLPWNVKFVIQPNQQNVYDEFCRHLITSEDESIDFGLPSTWEKSKENKIRFIVPKNTNEYKSTVADFEKQMQGTYTEIIKLERIQNERWYMQYQAHCKDFKNRLNEDTERRLYHGCPEQAATLIMEDCFNRSFAGVNGTLFGFGVYFSKNAVYSHGYTKANSNNERCMFISRVLVGKTTKGNSSMKTRPLGFDSTTDGDHMTVTYHDAQAYAEYLITYK